jgi:serine/threonine protein kinase
VIEIKLDESSSLGSGFFGVVCKGKVKSIDVAVKTLKENAQREVILSILEEIKVMSHLENHPNIVKFIGANTDELARGNIYSNRTIHS